VPQGALQAEEQLMPTSAKIVLDSVGPNGARLTTFELTYPRFIHAELMTHRVLSRNSASSRAIPTKRLVDLIDSDPARPVWWGRNQSGMQAREELEGDAKQDAQMLWSKLRSPMIRGALEMQEVGLHKQIANRVLEPWMHITVVATATEWTNLRALRVSPDAQPEFCDLATRMFALYDAHRPHVLSEGAWHVPYVTGVDAADLLLEGYSRDALVDISAGRCAAVSYLNLNGARDPAKDLERCAKLQSSGHMSPFEHQAFAMTLSMWESYADKVAGRWIRDRVPVGNFWGWGQRRKYLRDEHDFSKLDPPR
jgi:Thymidylate synthase complementing protein